MFASASSLERFSAEEPQAVLLLFPVYSLQEIGVAFMTVAAAWESLCFRLDLFFYFCKFGLLLLQYHVCCSCSKVWNGIWKILHVNIAQKFPVR